MGLLSRLAAKNYSMSDFNNDIRSWIGGRQSLSGVNVNEESAMRYVTVYSCVRVLAEALGSLPLAVYRERSDGGRDKARDHAIHYLLSAQPNDEMTSVTWREAQQGHLVLSGNSYSVITRSRRGEVLELYPVDWHNVNPVRDPETRRLEYHINDRGKIETFPAERIFHIPGFGFDGLRGYSPIRMAQETIGLGMAATEFASRFYGQGMNVGGILEVPGTLHDDSRQALREDIEGRGSGLANSWRPLILENGTKFARIPMPLDEAQFVETRKLNRDEICGLFRVPPHMIANLERSTNNNIEHQSLEFIMYTMLPYITRWEQTANWKLFSRHEREQGYYVKFNVAGLLRGDYKSRQEGLNIMRQNGVINADEWRALEEMNPQEGGTGKEYLVNGNMKTVTEAMRGTKGPRREPDEPGLPRRGGE